MGVNFKNNENKGKGMLVTDYTDLQINSFFLLSGTFQQLLFNFGTLIINPCLYFLQHMRFQSYEIINTITIYITTENNRYHFQPCFKTRTELRCN